MAVELLGGGPLRQAHRLFAGADDRRFAEHGDRHVSLGESGDVNPELVVSDSRAHTNSSGVKLHGVHVPNVGGALDWEGFGNIAQRSRRATDGVAI